MMYTIIELILFVEPTNIMEEKNNIHKLAYCCCCAT